MRLGCYLHINKALSVMRTMAPQGTSKSATLFEMVLAECSLSVLTDYVMKPTLIYIVFIIFY